MRSIALKFIISATAAVFCGSVFAADPSPRILNEPVLGLRYEAARVKFDPLPVHAFANCESMQDSEYGKSIWFIFAKVTDTSGRTYYVTGGYDIRKDVPKHLKYATGDYGTVYSTDRGTCSYIDMARQVFDDRLFNDELPEAVLKLLAADFAKRLVKAFGGPDKLRAELRNQHVYKDSLPPELLAALKRYFEK